MNTQLVVRALLSGAIIAAVSEIAKRNNAVASIVHSLPLVSVMAFIWLFAQTGDTGLIARHAQGTFWFVLPTLPMLLVLPWLLRHGVGFWPALAGSLVMTVGLYFLTMRLLKAAGVNL